MVPIFNTMVFIVKYMEIPFDTIPPILSWSLAFDLTACWKFGREIDTGTRGFNFYPMGTPSLCWVEKSTVVGTL